VAGANLSHANPPLEPTGLSVGGPLRAVFCRRLSGTPFGVSSKAIIAFQVAVNGEPVCTAGIDDFGVISAIMTWVGRRPEKSADGKSIEEELTFDVGGLDSTAAERLTWLKAELRVGDTVSIRVVDTDKVDGARERRKDDPEMVARAQRRYYEKLKQEYGE
jgi:hypothetical protein